MCLINFCSKTNEILYPLGLRAFPALFHAQKAFTAGRNGSRINILYLRQERPLPEKLTHAFGLRPLFWAGPSLGGGTMARCQGPRAAKGLRATAVIAATDDESTDRSINLASDLGDELLSQFKLSGGNLKSIFFARSAREIVGLKRRTAYLTDLGLSYSLCCSVITGHLCDIMQRPPG